jgi:hypothetical protein
MSYLDQIARQIVIPIELSNFWQTEKVGVPHRGPVSSPSLSPCLAQVPLLPELLGESSGPEARLQSTESLQDRRLYDLHFSLFTDSV